MYGTTIKNYTDKNTKMKKYQKDEPYYDYAPKKEKTKANKPEDTKYMKIEQESSYKIECEREATESFSFRDLPIASVVITLILTMMLLVMTSGFGGL